MPSSSHHCLISAWVPWRTELVEVWNSTKTAARLLAAQATAKGEKKPVLLRLDYDSGHGIGSTKSQALDERADTFAFMLWQMGQLNVSPQAR